MKASDDHMSVQEYYGKVLASNADLKTNACCSTEKIDEPIKSILAGLDDEILKRFYGCGAPFPEMLSGCRVLDLGCGVGRDAFVLSALAGKEGEVIGIDMTPAQLDIARHHQTSEAVKLGYSESNIRFIQGYIEDLKTAGIEDNSIDVVISNCVINLSPKKDAVFKEIFRVLKPGGELYFSDVFADRRISSELRQHPELLGECLGGAMYMQDFRRMLQQAGCNDYRVVSSRPLQISDSRLEKMIGNVNFSSATVRAFKLPCEDRCEDYGQTATYLGNLVDHPHGFRLDDHHYFEAHKPYPVCSNTAMMLRETRFAEVFRVTGDTSRHYGLFDCASPESVAASDLGCC